MAVVVVLIMIAFTVPTLISQWQRPGIKGSQPVAYYHNKKGTISNDDLLRAQMELNLLKAIGADIFLQIPAFHNADVGYSVAGTIADDFRGNTNSAAC